jgi:hypothetical protein
MKLSFPPVILKRWLVSAFDALWRFRIRQDGMRFASAKFLTDGVSRHGKTAIVIPDVPTRLFTMDTQPSFDVFTYNYDSAPLSRIARQELNPVRHIAFQSEFFGSSLERLVLEITDDYDSVAFICDDVLVSSSQVNTLLTIGQAHGLDWWSPAYSHCSFFSHYFMLSQPGRMIRSVDFLEWNCVLFSRKALLALQSGLRGSISGWGYDEYLVPHLLREAGATRFALVDSVVVRHCRPITSHHRTFSNNLTAKDEQRLFASRFPRR